jgi:hypothetical protein
LGQLVARTGALAIGLTAILALAACTEAAPPPKDGVPSRTKAEVTAEVQAQADQIAKAVGQPLQNAKMDPQKCLYKKKANDGSVIVMQASYTIALPEGQHVEAGARLRDAWKAAGWTVDTDKTTGKAVELTATGPSKMSARVGSTEPPNALVVVVQSTCFKTQDSA